MARASKNSTLESRSARAKLRARKAPYKARMDPGTALGYYKPSKGAGRWLAFQNPAKNDALRSVWRQASLGVADDLSDADGEEVLTYFQAQDKARKQFDLWEAEAKSGRQTREERRRGFTVADAMALYLRTAERQGFKGVAIYRSLIETWILPDLGELQVSDLTRPRLEEWKLALSESPRRKTGRNTSAPRTKWEAEPTPEQLKSRKNSANRVLGILKRALTLALDEGHVSGAAPWKEVKPFSKVSGSRVQFLTPEEQVRLLNCCPADFRKLVLAALKTGCRYSELTAMQVQDFNRQAGTVYVANPKSGRPHHVILDDEGIAHFEGLTTARPKADLIFLRANVERVTRLDQGNAWAACDQVYQMQHACAAAGLPPTGFHELRHSYASTLLNRGVPMAYVAAQLGHADTRMVEKHYGHLVASDLARSIRASLPQLDASLKPKIKSLKVKGA